MKRAILKFVTALVLGSLGTSCVGPRQPIYINPIMESSPPLELAVAPVIDRRLDKSIEVDLEGDLRASAIGMLQSKGYNVRREEFSGVGLESLSEMSADELCQVMPQNADGVVVIYLDDLTDETSFHLLMLRHITECALSGVLAGTECSLWEDSYTAERQVGGLINVALDSAVDSAFEDRYGGNMKDLFESLPDYKEAE